MTLPPLPVRMPQVRSSKKAEASADGNAVALGTAATAFFQGAGIGASMMLFQALSDAVARVSWILEEEEEGDETEKRELKFCSRQLLLDEKKAFKHFLVSSPSDICSMFSFLRLWY